MAYREFIDQAGVTWRAWDTYPSAVSNVRSVYAAGWLGFESDTERRRLHPVPERWDEATDDALREMLRTASQVQTRSTEEYLNDPRPQAPLSAPATGEIENSETHTALMDATRAVVERARNVLNAVTNTLAQTRKDDNVP